MNGIQKHTRSQPRCHNKYRLVAAVKETKKTKKVSGPCLFPKLIGNKGDYSFEKILQGPLSTRRPDPSRGTDAEEKLFFSSSPPGSWQSFWMARITVRQHPVDTFNWKVMIINTSALWMRRYTMRLTGPSNGPFPISDPFQWKTMHTKIQSVIFGWNAFSSSFNMGSALTRCEENGEIFQF